MGKKDMAAKAFFCRPDIVADICNCFIFEGKRVVRPEGVSELSAELFEGLQDENNRATPPDSLRVGDAFRHITYTHRRKRHSFDLGMEFQSTGGANIVLRQLDYLGRRFTRILNIRIKRHRGKLVPVIVLTISLICRPWNHPCSLKERFKRTDPLLKRRLKFTMNLLDPFALDEKIINLMCPELKTVINCFRYSGDREKLFEILENIPGGTLSREAVHLLNTFLHLGLIIPENEERVHMCKAVREMRRILRKEGRKEGMEKGMEKGKAKGMAMGEEKVLLSMLHRNATPEQIHQLTGISLKRILALAAANVPTTVTP